jgi:hypothetical protein
VEGQRYSAAHITEYGYGLAWTRRDLYSLTTGGTRVQQAVEFRRGGFRRDDRGAVGIDASGH